jgi:hypothetical protein
VKIYHKDPEDALFCNVEGQEKKIIKNGETLNIEGVDFKVVHLGKTDGVVILEHQNEEK